MCELKRLIKRGGASKEIWCKAQPLGAAVPPAGTSWRGALKSPPPVCQAEYTAEYPKTGELCPGTSKMRETVLEDGMQC